MSTVAIVQARMASVRLPGKVLTDLLGRPMLWHVVRRLGKAELVDKVVVATSEYRSDQPIADLCQEQGWACYRGSHDDLLDRYVNAAREHSATVVVRVTADCPLIDPEIVDRCVVKLQRNDLDYVSTDLPHRTFPRGLDAEAMTFSALDRALREDANPNWREHATPYIYRNPNAFRLGSLANETDESGRRWTVDTIDDLAFVRMIFSHFGHGDFTWREAFQAVEAHPEWALVNGHVVQKEVL